MLRMESHLSTLKILTILLWYDASDESHEGFDTVHFRNNANNDSDGDIPNKCGPAIELYGSESNDTDGNDSGDLDDETSGRNRALECEEDEYWVDHNSGEDISQTRLRNIARKSQRTYPCHSSNLIIF